jgi:hypothetical protein
MLRRVAHVRTDISEEPSASIIRVTRIGELETTLAVTSVRRLLVTANVVPSSPILVTLIMLALGFTETSVLTRATRRNISEDRIFTIIVYLLEILRICMNSLDQRNRCSGRYTHIASLSRV